MVEHLRYVLVLFVCIYGSSWAAPPKAALYSVNDQLHIDVLDLKSMQRILYRQSRSQHYIIQVFNSYCGHCINFAPHFKELVSSLCKWDHIVKFAVMDSAHSANRNVIRFFNITAVPTLVFVSVNTTIEQRYQSTVIVNTFNITELHNIILDKISPFVPALAPTFHFNLPVDTFDHFIVSTTSKKSVNDVKAVILNLLPIYSSATIIWRPGSLSRSGLIVKKFNPVLNSSHLLSLRSVNDAYRLEELILNSVSDRAAVQRLVSSWHVHESASSVTLQPTANTESLLDDHVHVYDIESAIYRALISDVSVVGSDRHWDSVISFVSLLNYYLVPQLPTVNSLRLQLQTLNSSISLDRSLSTDNWQALLRRCQFPDVPADKWVACKGSKPFLRGYPCGLWLLFHSLTVLRLQNGYHSPPILPVMKSFIINIFSCPHCAQNFAKETSHYNPQLSASPRAELLYLWHVHNKVNKRLRHQASEDPSYPKLPYPLVKHCKTCREDEEYLIKYLTNKLKVSSWRGLVGQIVSHKPTPIVLQVNTSFSLFNIGFSFVDISLCLFFFSSALLILLVVFCKLNRSSWMKNFSIRKVVKTKYRV